MKTENWLIAKKFLLGILVILMVIGAAYVEFWARYHRMHFEHWLGGALYLLSSLIILLAGVVFVWVLPMDTRVGSLREATKIAVVLGLIPGITLILRVLQWMLIAPPVNYALRHWTMLSAVPPLWLGLMLGWWVRVWRGKRDHTE